MAGHTSSGYTSGDLGKLIAGCKRGEQSAVDLHVIYEQIKTLIEENTPLHIAYSHVDSEEIKLTLKERS